MNNNPIPIDASRARGEFSKILDRVYLENKTFLIKKSGIPVAEIIKPRLRKGKDIMDFAGIWKKDKEDRKKFENYIRKLHRSFHRE